MWLVFLKHLNGLHHLIPRYFTLVLQIMSMICVVMEKLGTFK